MAAAAEESAEIKPSDLNQATSEGESFNVAVGQYESLRGKYGFSGDELTLVVRRYTPDTAIEKKMLRKVDLFQIPILWFMCVMAYIDRNNIVSHPMC